MGYKLSQGNWRSHFLGNLKKKNEKSVAVTVGKNLIQMLVPATIVEPK